MNTKIWHTIKISNDSLLNVLNPFHPRNALTNPVNKLLFNDIFQKMILKIKTNSTKSPLPVVQKKKPTGKITKFRECDPQ